MNYVEVMNRIKLMCKKRKLKAYNVNELTLKVHSEKYDFECWLIQIKDDEIYLYHNHNLIRNNYHLQRRYEIRHWKGCVREINKHNKYVINRRKYRETDWVTDILRKNNQKVTMQYGN